MKLVIHKTYKSIHILMTTKPFCKILKKITTQDTYFMI